MADTVMSNLPLRRVLECVREKYHTAEEITAEHNKKFPRELEALIRASNAVRRFVFKEKKGPSVQDLLSSLADLGYVEAYTTTFHHVELEKETTFYRLNNKGRSALYSVMRNRR